MVDKKIWNLLDFIIEMMKPSRFIMWENFARETTSNICVHLSSNCLEGNLEMHKYGAQQYMRET